MMGIGDSQPAETRKLWSISSAIYWEDLSSSDWEYYAKVMKE